MALFITSVAWVIKTKGLLQLVLVNDGNDGVTTDGTRLASLATGMTGVEMSAWVEHGLLCGVVANQTLLLFGVLIDHDGWPCLLRNVRVLYDFNVFGVLHAIVVLVSGSHEFDGGGFDAERAPLYAEVAGELTIRGGEVAWSGDAHTEFTLTFDTGEVDVGFVCCSACT